MFFSGLPTPTDVLAWALIAHLAADWLFQTDWMAMHKVDLRHPAGWVHATIYALCMAVVFPLPAALAIGALHLLVDTRVPVRWWMRSIKGMSDQTPGANVVELGVDQVFHVMVIAGAALLLASF